MRVRVTSLDTPCSSPRLSNSKVRRAAHYCSRQLSASQPYALAQPRSCSCMFVVPRGLGNSLSCQSLDALRLMTRTGSSSWNRTVTKPVGTLGTSFGASADKRECLSSGLHADVFQHLPWGESGGSQRTLPQWFSRHLEGRLWPVSTSITRGSAANLSRLVTPRLMMEEREFLSLTHSPLSALN